MTMLLVRVPSSGVVPVVVIDDHGQTLRVRLATRAIVQPPEFRDGVMDQHYVWLLALLAVVVTATWLWRVVFALGVM